jgi:ubiquinone/menaquinone biosynthesis C-methylase UbiE
MATMMEKAGGASHRQELLAGLSGRAVEVGAGTGLNFLHYPDSVTEVIAIEPEDHLREVALDAASRAVVTVRVIDGVAERLPFEDGELDAGIASLVLCSVSDPKVALGELRRVIRPGGELRFYEHVRSANHKRAKWQDRANILWPLIAGGCQCNRMTEETICHEGFRILDARHFRFQPSLLCAPMAPFVIGRAVRI